MPDNRLAEVQKMAHGAHTISNDALSKAERAIESISHHEQLCSERYSNINEKLSEVKRAQSLAAADSKNSIEKIYAALDVLRTTTASLATNTSTRTNTTDQMLRWFFGFVGVAGFLYGIMHT